MLCSIKSLATLCMYLINYSPAQKNCLQFTQTYSWTILSLLSVLVLCAIILSYICYTLISIDISVFMCLFTFYFMSVYVSLYYHCVLAVIIMKLLTYLLSICECDECLLICSRSRCCGRSVRLTETPVIRWHCRADRSPASWLMHSSAHSRCGTRNRRSSSTTSRTQHHFRLSTFPGIPASLTDWSHWSLPSWSLFSLWQF